jgi:hypothetical protein
VSALAFEGGSVFAGGSFVTIGGQARVGIAKLAGTGSGAADLNWNPGTDGVVLALARDGLGNLYVGGEFTGFGRQARKGFAKVTTGTGDVDAVWNSMPSGDPIGAALAVDATGTRSYAGGFFQGIGDKISGGFATLSGTDAFASPGPLFIGSPGIVNGIARDASGNTVVGGSFMAVGNTSGITLRLNVARFLNDGTLDTTWNPNADDTVLAVAVDSSSNVLVGGNFHNVGGQVRNYAARLLPSGAGQADPAWDANADAPVRAFALDASGNIYVGVGLRQHRRGATQLHGAPGQHRSGRCGVEPGCERVGARLGPRGRQRVRGGRFHLDRRRRA